jgi:hypothetical protein
MHAGEVGDGPDQGHSGGADSVPPAPDLTYSPTQVRKPAEKLKGPTTRRKREVGPLFCQSGPRLGLRLFCPPRFQEHRPNTCNSGGKKIHRCGTTLRCLLLMTALLTRVASVTAASLVGQRRWR